MDGDTHLIAETSDGFGRSTGYTYSKNGAVQHTDTTGYGTDGRINSAGFTHGGAIKLFGYEYLNGTNLLHKLTKPNNMTLTQTYEATRDLLTGMAYHRGSTLVAQREYTYDILGRPTARNTARNGQIVNDTFAHNTRSELVEAQVNGTDYEYAYDNIGNRQQATVGNDVTVYDANALNQYTSIRENGAVAFVPQFDADGNQTLIKTETGIWSAVYNAENRPVTFTNSENNTVVECAYDSMGRRAYKKVTVDGSVTLHQRYIYRGYLQIACIDLTRSHHPVMWLVTWDPTQPVATRPLAIRKDGTWYAYGWDLTKNICEVFGPAGYIRTAYTYSPYGQVTATGDVTQPIQWSSEIWDEELGLVYYNYRHYNPTNGRWNRRDELPCVNLYRFISNNMLHLDFKGLLDVVVNINKKPTMNIKGVKIPKEYSDNLFKIEDNFQDENAFAITTAYYKKGSLKVEYSQTVKKLYIIDKISINFDILVITNDLLVHKNAKGEHYIYVPSRNRKSLIHYQIVLDDENDHVKDIERGLKVRIPIKLQNDYSSYYFQTKRKCEESIGHMEEIIKNEYFKIAEESSLKYDQGPNAPHVHRKNELHNDILSVEENLERTLNGIKVP